MTNTSANQSSNGAGSFLEEGPYPSMDFDLGLKLGVSVMCVTILIVGTIGNLLVPVVVWKNKGMRNSTNMFLVNLSIADLLVLLICVPTVLVEINSRPETWILGNVMCKMVPFLESTVAHGSVLTILCISFERYYAICQPLRAGYKCTKRRAFLIIVILWSISVVVTSPVIVSTTYFHAEYLDGSTVPVCFVLAQSQWRKTYFICMQMCFFFLPLIVLIVVYSIITKELMETATLPSGPRTSTKDTRADQNAIKTRKQVVVTLAAVVVSFFVCLLPMKVFQSWVILSPTQQVKNMGANSYFNVLFSARMMLYANSAVNPILYNVISSKFRDAFMRQIRCQKERIRHKNTISLTTSTTAGANHNFLKENARFL